MSTKTIQIQVDDEAARVYESASVEEREKLDAQLSLRLREVTRPGRSLEAIMSEISRKAQERGLSPKILESLLEER